MGSGEEKGKDVPVGDYPQDNQVFDCVVSNSAIATIVLLCPVKDSLGQGHDCRRESDDVGWWPFSDMCEVEVGDVEEGLEDIE